MDEVDTLDWETAHAFSLGWLLFNKKLPSEVIESISSWMEAADIPRMNQEVLSDKMAPEDGKVVIDTGDLVVEVAGVEGAPPSGGTAVNYSR